MDIDNNDVKIKKLFSFCKLLSRFKILPGINYIPYFEICLNPFHLRPETWFNSSSPQQPAIHTVRQCAIFRGKRR